MQIRLGKLELRVSNKSRAIRRETARCSRKHRTAGLSYYPYTKFGMCNFIRFK